MPASTTHDPAAAPLLRAATWLWAAPWTLLGLALALLAVAAGGEVRRVGGTLEVALARRRPPPWSRLLPFRAITLGHVILGPTHRDLRRLRAHERVHVAQYERWGPAFVPAYLACSAWFWLRGRRAYWDNPFEVEARRRSASNVEANERSAGAPPPPRRAVEARDLA